MIFGGSSGVESDLSQVSKARPGPTEVCGGITICRDLGHPSPEMGYFAIAGSSGTGFLRLSWRARDLVVGFAKAPFDLR
jgi:hypothetical protein